jgi:Arc/MetJ-type ribon-helix-helix transcriptional regulator
MNNDLPASLERLAHAKVQSNRFKFSGEAIKAAARLLREHEVAEKTPRPLEANRDRCLAATLIGT